MPQQTAVMDFLLRDPSDQKKVPADLYDKKAEAIARQLVSRIDGKREPEGVKRHQLRRMFDEFKRLQRMLDAKGDQAWDDILPLVKLIKSKAAYAVARQRTDRSYYDNLNKFLQRGVDLVATAEDFRRFVTLFEAVYGFYYSLGGADTEK